MDTFVKILFITLILLLLLFGTLYVFSLITSYQKKRAGKHRSVSAREALHEYAKRCGSSKKLIPHSYFPLYGRNGRILKYVPCDEIAVCADGILVLTVFDRAGSVDNSSPDVWAVDDGARIREVTSPLVFAERSGKTVRSILAKHGMDDVEVFSAVVLTNKSTVLKIDSDDVLPASELGAVFAALHSKMTLGISRQFDIQKLLTELAVSAEEMHKISERRN